MAYSEGGIMDVQEFYDAATNTLTYLVFDSETKDGVVIDPVLNFDQATGRVSHSSLQEILTFVEAHKIKLHWTLDTHVHADHLSAGNAIKKRIPSLKYGMSRQLKVVQDTFVPIFGASFEDVARIQAFDVFLEAGETYHAGSIKFRAMATPGHTPACTCFVFGEDEIVFTGDVLFMPDSGTGRCDFPGGSSEELFHSVSEVLYSLPGNCKVYVGHDYQPGGRDLAYQSTIAEQKAKNIHIKSDTQKTDFIEFRENRDKQLSAPKLLLPSLQVNITGGVFLFQEQGQYYLKTPLKGC